MSKELVWQLFRFAVVGGTVTGVFMGLNHLLNRWFSKNVAFLVAYPPAVALHFCLNKWWTFKDAAKPSVGETSQYLIMTGVAFVIQWSVFQLLIKKTRTKPWLASGIATVAQMALAFVAMRLWVFAAGR